MEFNALSMLFRCFTSHNGVCKAISQIFPTSWDKSPTAWEKSPSSWDKIWKNTVRPKMQKEFN